MPLVWQKVEGEVSGIEDMIGINDSTTKVLQKLSQKLKKHDKSKFQTDDKYLQ